MSVHGGAAPAVPIGRRELWTVLAMAVVWFALLGYRDLMDPDEGRYAEIPREMVVSGDWITPRLQGLKYFEKPALQYWTTALIFELFGRSNATARLWVALAGFAGALWTGYLGRRLFGNTVGRMAFLISASGLLYFAMGHLLTLDMSLTFFLTLALGSLMLAQQARERTAHACGWMMIAWAALAGAVLSKGLVGLVLPAGALGIYLLWQRDWALLRHLHLGKGLLLFLALCAPWFWAVGQANPEFLHFFFVHEHFERFTTTEHGRQGPPYYFLAIALLGAFPWTLLTVRALLQPNLGRRSRGEFQSARLIWVYVLFVLVFFSISRSKMEAYILPIFPFAALMAARHAATLERWRGDGWILLGCALGLAAAMSQTDQFATESTPVELVAASARWGFMAVVGFAAAGAVLLVSRGSQETRMVGAAVAVMLSAQAVFCGVQELAPSRSGRELARRIEQLPVPSDTPLYFVGHYSPSMAFYLDRLPVIVDYAGELQFGIDVEPGRVLKDSGVFAAQWRQHAQAIAVIANRQSRYLELGLSMNVIESGPWRTLVVKSALAPSSSEPSGG